MPASCGPALTEMMRTYHFGRKTALQAQRLVLLQGRVLRPASTHPIRAVVQREAATQRRGSTPSSEFAVEVAVDHVHVVVVAVVGSG